MISECIVTKWMDGGPLNEWLERHRKENGGQCLSWAARGRAIALDIASGLAYLHSEGKVHRDMKSLNVLIDQDGTAVLADFGFAKSVETSKGFSLLFFSFVLIFLQKVSLQVATFQMGTIHWMSPEMIRDELYSFSSDMYAFGIIVWEILSCRIPYANFAKRRLLEDAVLSGERPPVDPSWPAEARELMQRTWCNDPNARLKAGEVVKMLSAPYTGPVEKPQLRRESGAPPPAPLVNKESFADLIKEGKRLVDKKQFVDASVQLRKVSLKDINSLLIFLSVCKALWAKSGDVEALDLLTKCSQEMGDFVGALVYCEKGI